MEEEVGGVQYNSAVVVYHPEEDEEKEFYVLDLNKMNKNIVSTKVTKEALMLVRNKKINIRT